MNSSMNNHIISNNIGFGNHIGHNNGTGGAIGTQNGHNNTTNHGNISFKDVSSHNNGGNGNISLNDPSNPQHRAMSQLFTLPYNIHSHRSVPSQRSWLRSQTSTSLGGNGSLGNFGDNSQNLVQNGHNSHNLAQNGATNSNNPSHSFHRRKTISQASSTSSFHNNAGQNGSTTASNASNSTQAQTTQGHFEYKAKHLFQHWSQSYPKQTKQVDMSMALSTIWRLRDETSVNNVPKGILGETMELIVHPEWFQKQGESEEGDGDDGDDGNNENNENNVKNNTKYNQTTLINDYGYVLHYERAIARCYDIDGVYTDVKDYTGKLKEVERAIISTHIDSIVADRLHKEGRDTGRVGKKLSRGIYSGNNCQ
jgi:hypothetical protein